MLDLQPRLRLGGGDTGDGDHAAHKCDRDKRDRFSEELRVATRESLPFFQSICCHRSGEGFNILPVPFRELLSSHNLF